MRICDTKAHGEIVFEGGYCGACDAIDDLEKGNDLRAVETWINDHRLCQEHRSKTWKMSWKRHKKNYMWSENDEPNNRQ
jgi:hypothetical protein